MTSSTNIKTTIPARGLFTSKLMTTTTTTRATTTSAKTRTSIQTATQTATQTSTQTATQTKTDLFSLSPQLLLIVVSAVAVFVVLLLVIVFVSVIVCLCRKYQRRSSSDGYTDCNRADVTNGMATVTFVYDKNPLGKYPLGKNSLGENSLGKNHIDDVTSNTVINDVTVSPEVVRPQSLLARRARKSSRKNFENLLTKYNLEPQLFNAEPLSPDQFNWGGLTAATIYEQVPLATPLPHQNNDF